MQLTQTAALTTSVPLSPLQISEDQLRSVFEVYGGVAYARIPPGKGCGFVQFLERAPAERALNVSEESLGLSVV